MYLKELRYYFSTPIAYIVIGLYLLIVELFLWVLPGEYNIIESGYSQADGLFAVSGWLYMFVCPALCMRLFAEEKTTGTWQLLLSKPFPLWRIVTEKYLAALTIVVVSLLPTLINYVMVYYLAEPVGNIDSGAFFGSFIGLLTLLVTFIAIGMFAASLTSNQIVAFILGALFIFIAYYGFSLLSGLFTNAVIAKLIGSLSLYEHYTSLSRGIIDLRDIVYFLSVAVVGILLTIALCNRDTDSH